MSLTPLTKEQRTLYEEQGFLILEGLVAPDEIEELKEDAVDICRGRYPYEALQPVNGNLSDDEVMQNFLCIHQPHKVSPVMLRYMHHPNITSVLSQVVAPGVKCMQSMSFTKPPDHPGQAWHQDEFYIPTRDRSLCGAWIAMDDASIENGCLWVIPGSHRTGYIYPQREHHRPDKFDFANESYGFDDSGELPVEVPAGTVLFFNGHLLHRSAKNRSTAYRRVLVNHYMNAFSLLPWGQAQVDYRDIVMVAGEDPYAWKGIEGIAKPHLRPRRRPLIS